MGGRWFFIFSRFNLSMEDLLVAHHCDLCCEFQVELNVNC